MEPIVLIHGYSAESKDRTLKAITEIYGSLPEELRKTFGRQAVVEIDLSRYISLEDGITIDDLSRGLDRALHQDFPGLLNSAFHVIIHSTGALVIRNWIRRFSPRPSPVRNLIHLAGANLGSGWAHIGKGQIARWGRLVFQGGTERGIQVLDALELGSNWTVDLHLHFLRPGNRMYEDYRVCEHVVIGSQADVKWYPIPIRNAKEDGADGVVRVSASNLNFNYLRFGPTAEARALQWREAVNYASRHRQGQKTLPAFYELLESSRPGAPDRPKVPFAIPYECAHSGDRMGVVGGSAPRAQVMRLLKAALTTTHENWPDLVELFDKETAATYERALKKKAPAWWKAWIDAPRAQYDPHAQLVFRLRDQDGRPVKHFDVFFNSLKSDQRVGLAIKNLFEDKHVNDVTPGMITFYLRTDAFDAKQKKWVPRVRQVDGCNLEITGTEPQTDDILYLPMRFEFSTDQLVEWIQGHRTTIIDVELLRLPS
ncbi:MAG TPA: hypothetical protein VMS21_11635, partial [Methylomirabilota bacterium]|nr:hypothetical protein [Methylomirabilota bacterium]